MELFFIPNGWPFENAREDMLETFPFVRDFPAPGRRATDFPMRADGGFVYVLCWLDKGHEVPFYVGETGRLNERLDDYCAKQFGAPTDFRVGEAVCYFREVKRLKIIVRYRSSALQKADRCRDEYLTIRGFQTAGIRLLNDFVSYRYKGANPDEERDAVRKFCEVLISHQRAV